MLGYKVWIDKEGLLGGERFWATIQKALDCSIKVLFVYSKNIVTTEGILRQGIENELEYAKSIAAQDGLQDFIIPLHIDNSNYHLVIGQPNINHIPFNNNWADGLKQLLKKIGERPRLEFGNIHGCRMVGKVHQLAEVGRGAGYYDICHTDSSGESSTMRP